MNQLREAVEKLNEAKELVRIAEATVKLMNEDIVLGWCEWYKGKTFVITCIPYEEQEVHNKPHGYIHEGKTLRVSKAYVNTTNTLSPDPLKHYVEFWLKGKILKADGSVGQNDGESTVRHYIHKEEINETNL